MTGRPTVAAQHKGRIGREEVRLSCIIDMPLVCFSMSLNRFRTALDDLHALQRELTSITGAREGNWRKHLVDARRRLSVVMGQLVVAAPELETTADTLEKHHALRRSLSKLRTMLAEHQANWPAVALDTANPTFRESLSKVVAASAALDEAVAALGDFR